jgi:hypothetical protein
MLLLIASNVLFLFLGFIYGFFLRNLWDKLRALKTQIEAKVKHQPTPQSSILEPPLTPAERVAREQEELLERLNPS